MTLFPFMTFGQVLFNGGNISILILTVLLVLLVLAARKAPNWVKEIGIAALVVSILIQAIFWIHTIDVIIQCDGSIHPVALWETAFSSLLNITYGLIIYFISLVIRIINKPRK